MSAYYQANIYWRAAAPQQKTICKQKRRPLNTHRHRHRHRRCHCHRHRHRQRWEHRHCANVIVVVIDIVIDIIIGSAALFVPFNWQAATSARLLYTQLAFPGLSLPFFPASLPCQKCKCAQLLTLLIFSWPASLPLHISLTSSSGCALQAHVN